MDLAIYSPFQILPVPKIAMLPLDLDKGLRQLQRATQIAVNHTTDNCKLDNFSHRSICTSQIGSAKNELTEATYLSNCSRRMLCPAKAMWSTWKLLLVALTRSAISVETIPPNSVSEVSNRLGLLIRLTSSGQSNSDNYKLINLLEVWTRPSVASTCPEIVQRFRGGRVNRILSLSRLTTQ